MTSLRRRLTATVSSVVRSENRCHYLRLDRHKRTCRRIQSGHHWDLPAPASGNPHTALCFNGSNVNRGLAFQPAVWRNPPIHDEGIEKNHRPQVSAVDGLVDIPLFDRDSPEHIRRNKPIQTDFLFTSQSICRLRLHNRFMTKFRLMTRKVEKTLHPFVACDSRGGMHRYASRVGIRKP